MVDNRDSGNDEENPMRQIGRSSWDWNDDSAGDCTMEPLDEDGAGRKIGNQSDDFTKLNNVEKSRSTSRNYPIGSQSHPPFQPKRCWLVRGTIPFTPTSVPPWHSNVQMFKRSDIPSHCPPLWLLLVTVRARFFMLKFSPYSTNSTTPISSSNSSLDYPSQS